MQRMTMPLPLQVFKYKGAHVDVDESAIRHGLRSSCASGLTCSPDCRRAVPTQRVDCTLQQPSPANAMQVSRSNDRASVPRTILRHGGLKV